MILELNLKRRKLEVLKKTVKVEFIPEKEIKGLFPSDEKKLGQGGFGSVTKVTDPWTNKVVALKKMAYNGQEIAALTEVKFLRILSGHANTVTILKAFKTEVYYYIFMELVGDGTTLGDLVYGTGKHLTKPYTEANLHIAFIQCVSALNFVHSKDVAHRDVKLENILVRNWDTFDIVLADFNLSKDNRNTETLMTTVCGTVTFKAPEIYTDFHYDYKCDIWSLGIAFYALFSHGQLDPCLVPIDGWAGKMSIDLQFVPKDQFSNVSNKAKDLLKKILVVDPNKRVNYEEILRHKWIKTKNSKIKNDFNLSRPKI